jgi:hypothetical protein
VDILYIWDGKPLPESRERCIRATMGIYPEARYFCITRAGSFLGFSVISWEGIQKEMADYFGFKQIPYAWLDNRTFADWARFWYLGTHGETLYLDTDATMTARYPFENEYKVVYSPGNICLLYSPKGFKRENFLALQEKQARIHPGQLMGFHKQFNDVWAKPIPEGFFHHHG